MAIIILHVLKQNGMACIYHTYVNEVQDTWFISKHKLCGYNIIVLHVHVHYGSQVKGWDSV